MKGRFITRQLDPKACADLLTTVMPIPGEDAPHEVMGWFQAGKLRRVRADYPNGWRLQFSISVRGGISRVQANLKLTIKGAVKGIGRDEQ